MTDVTQGDAPEDDQATSIYDELPDAPPKKRLKLSWTGKLGVVIVAFWIIMAIIGPMIAPFHEADTKYNCPAVRPVSSHWTTLSPPF